MSKHPAVAMSETDGTISLLGHDDELGALHWKQDIGADHCKKARKRALAFMVTLLFILLTIFFILYLQWHSAFEAPGSKLAESPNLVTVPGPKRDLKFLLHPEDHVSRDSSVRHFSWIITKATIAPNGAKKEVFLINSKINSLLAL